MDLDENSIKLLFEHFSWAKWQKDRQTDRQEHPWSPAATVSNVIKWDSVEGKEREKRGSEKREEREWQIQICADPQPLWETNYTGEPFSPLSPSFITALCRITTNEWLLLEIYVPLSVSTWLPLFNGQSLSPLPCTDPKMHHNALHLPQCNPHRQSLTATEEYILPQWSSYQTDRSQVQTHSREQH